MGVQVQRIEPEPAAAGVCEFQSTLRRLEAGVERLRQMMPPPPPAIAPQVTPARLGVMIKARRARESVLGADLFADPAWDMLLEAYRAHLLQARLSVTSLCHGAAVPATTALRWLQKLEQDGWLTRTADPLDARRVWVQLSAEGSARMSQYFSVIHPDVIPV